eukprot:g9005.t1
MDDAIARGITSIATGEVDGIEDVAEALNFDADTAEGLSFLASSATHPVAYSKLSASSSLHKLTDKLGVEMETIASLLAVVNADWGSASEISATLPLLDIDPRYVKAILATYSYDKIFKPEYKTTNVIEAIIPLKNLYAPNLDKETMGSLVRLVQGDATVIRGMLGDTLAYSRQERNTLCALVLVAQTCTTPRRKRFEQLKRLDFSPTEDFDWDKTRSARVSARMIARVLNINRRAVFRIIAACHDHPKSLAIVADYLGVKDEPKTAKTRLRAIAGIVDEDEDDDDKVSGGDGDGTESAEEDDDDDASSVTSNVSSTSGMSVASDLKRSRQTQQDIQNLTERLNNKYPVVIAATGKKKTLVDEKTISWLIHLALGDVKHRDWSFLKSFVAKMRQRERNKKGNPAVTTFAVQQILALAVGDDRVWSPDSTWWEVTGEDMNANQGEEEEYGVGLLKELAFKELLLPVSIQFIVMLGTGNQKSWRLEQSDGVPSSKIHPNSRIVTCLSALAAKDTDVIDNYLPNLCKVLATDIEVVRSITCLALGDTSRLSQEVGKIIRRIGGNTTLPFALGFCAGATLEMKEVKDMIAPICNNLSINCDLAASIILSTQCKRTVSVNAWKKMCNTAMILKDEDGIITEEELQLPRFWLVDAIAALLQKQKLKIVEFSDRLDEFIGYKGLWKAVFESGNVKGKDGKPMKEPPADYKSISSVLYAIAQNDLRALPHVLKVMGMGEKSAVTSTVLLVQIFNRRFSYNEVKAVEKTIQDNDEETNLFPSGCFMAVAAGIVGGLDTFAAGINSITKIESLPFYHLEGLPELLVSLKLNDEHGDVEGVFREAIKLICQKSKNGIVHTNRSVGHRRRSMKAKAVKITSKWRYADGSDREDASDIYLCPITKSIMLDPVNADDGYTYERSAIEKWLSLNNTSPMTGTAMSDKLTPNYSLRSAIKESRQREVSETTAGITLENDAPVSTIIKNWEDLSQDKEIKLLHFVYAVLVKDTKLLLENIDVFNFDPQLAAGLARVADRTAKILVKFSKNPFEEFIKRIDAMTENDKKINFTVFSNLMKVLSRGYSGLGEGRTGISVQMHELAKTYLDEPDVKALDAVYLSHIDAPSHMEVIIGSVPRFLYHLDICNDKMIELVNGLIYLTSPKDSQDSEKKARKKVVKHLSKSFNAKENVIRFCLGLARSNMELVRLMGEQVGEFDLEVMSDIFTLVKRLTPICKASEMGSETKREKQNDGKKSSEIQKNTAIEELHLDPQAVFSECVPGGDSFMTFFEFKEAMKIYGLQSHNQRLMQLFLMGDESGTGVLTASSFIRLTERIIHNLTADVKLRIGQTGLQFFRTFSISLLVLVALFAFVLVGVEAFSVSGGFAAATTGSLFAVIAGFLQQQDISVSDSEGESGDSALKVDVSDPSEVAQILDNILSIHTIH